MTQRLSKPPHWSRHAHVSGTPQPHLPKRSGHYAGETKLEVESGRSPTHFAQNYIARPFHWSLISA